MYVSSLRTGQRRASFNWLTDGMTGPVGHFHVDDIAATVTALLEAGGTEKQAAHDVGGADRGLGRG